MSEVPVVDIYWEGPFEDYLEITKYVTENERGINTDYFFYQIYGQHLSDSIDTLLYIGMSNISKSECKTDGIIERLRKHDENWTGGLRSEIKIYIGSYGSFKNWKHWNDPVKNKYYKRPSKEEGFPSIPEIEALLIYAHKPAINCASIKNIKKIKNKFYIFNTGKRRSLLPELSTRYYISNPQEEKIVTA